MKHLLTKKLNKYLFTICVDKGERFLYNDNGSIESLGQYKYTRYYKNNPYKPKNEFYYTIYNDIVRPMNFILNYFTNKILCKKLLLSYGSIYSEFIYAKYYYNKHILYNYNVYNSYFSFYNLYMIIYYFIAPNEHETKYLNTCAGLYFYTQYSIYKCKELNLCINNHIMNYIFI